MRRLSWLVVLVLACSGESTTKEEPPPPEPRACDICDPDACPGSECVRTELDAGAFDCFARSRPGAYCRR